ncbi:MAG: phosphoribosylaminoimidazolesuccinocarboxamide synthase [Vicinamibacterales bacterium]
MTGSAPLLTTTLPGVPLLRRGKVRDVYDLGETLLIVATDRISAFDYVLGSGIPDKGRLLTQMSAFWFRRFADIVPNHLISTRVEDFPSTVRAFGDELADRSMLVRKTTPLPVECVARGYLAGSGWKDYVRTGSVCGVALPPGLSESAALPEPIFTPATKADTGHDENISESVAATVLGADRVRELHTLTLRLYDAGVRHAADAGLLVADTKFEFGVAADGTLLLIDEVLTPDSSRFWDAATYRAGGPQPSFDKQFVRDYLERIAWNKQPPVPALPDDIVERTRGKYLEAFARITGRTLD